MRAHTSTRSKTPLSSRWKASRTGALKEVQESLRIYIDFESWADDAEMNGDIFSVGANGRAHTFWSR
jgi:hypothetical protein